MKTGKALLIVLVALIGLASGGAAVWLAGPALRDMQTEPAHDHDEHDEDEAHEKHDAHDGHEHDAKAEAKHDEHNDADAHDDHAGHDHSAEAKTLVPLSEAQQRRIGVKLAVAGPGELTTRLSLPGEVVVNADRTAHIAPRAPGVVRQVFKTIGDPVREGETLALIESAELGEAKVDYLSKLNESGCCQLDLTRAQAVHENTGKLLALLKKGPSLEDLRNVRIGDMGENRSKLVSAYAEVVLARTTYEREKGLFERKVGSESDYLAAANAYKKAEADYAALQDSAAFEVKRTLLEQQRALRVAEFARAAAERRLYILGLSAEDVRALASTAPAGGAGPTHQCANPDCANCRRARAAAAASQRAVIGEKLAWYGLRSPFAGTVIERHATLGEKLGDDADAFTVADLSGVWVDLSVYQKDLRHLRKGQEARVSAEQAGPAATGRVVYVAPVIDSQTRTGLVRLELPNPDGRWRPGLFVTAEVVVGQASASVVAPTAAVQRLDQDRVVFVHTPKGFEPRPIRIGRSSRTHVEVLAGLAAGERYAVDGAFELKAHIVTSGIDAHAGHGH